MITRNFAVLWFASTTSSHNLRGMDICELNWCQRSPFWRSQLLSSLTQNMTSVTENLLLTVFCLVSSEIMRYIDVSQVTSSGWRSNSSLVEMCQISSYSLSGVRRRQDCSSFSVNKLRIAPEEKYNLVIQFKSFDERRSWINTRLKIIPGDCYNLKVEQGRQPKRLVVAVPRVIVYQPD